MNYQFSMKNRDEIRIGIREKIKEHIVKNKARQISLVNRTVTILHDLNNQVFNFYLQNETNKKEFKDDISKQAIHTLFRKSISQIESILILIENGKYIEAYSILRDFFENSIFFLYIIQYPFESDRWLHWAGMNFKAREEYRKRNEKLNNFKLFLQENNYNELLTLLTLENFRNYRDFNVWFVREQAFKNHPSLKGSDFKEAYHELCKFVHPSVIALNHNDTLSETHFDDIVKDILHIAKNIADIFIDYFQNILNENLIQEFLNIENEIKKNNGEVMLTNM